MKKGIYFLLVAASAMGMAAACSKSDKKGGTSRNSSVSGKLTSLSASSFNESVGTMSTKTITHVMAVSPSTANADRSVASVSADGSFSLGVDSGKPWLIVFVSQDGTLTGPDMIVGVVRVSANNLDTLPIARSGSVALGDVSVSSGTATPSTTVSDLLSALGLSSAEASFIGGIDDLALRLANPDVDVNGVIDATEGKNFMMDWHVRAETQLNGSPMRISDITDQYANPANLTLNWNLGSAYAIYPTSFDNTDYIVNGGVSTQLQNGGAFTATGTSVNPTSMSGGTFGSSRSWGPDYNMTTQELGGSDAAATFTYQLGSASKILRYSNVRTRTKASLNADGTVIPFIRINTSGGNISGIGYKWMKKSGSTWVDATTSEVSMIAQETGAYLMLYTQKGNSGAAGLTFTIPASSQTGTINIGDAGFRAEGVASPTTVTTNQVCSTAMSYDDKMGLRLFAGSPLANTGVTACP